MDTEMVSVKILYFLKDYPVSFSKETGCLNNSASAEYINRNPLTTILPTCVCVNNVEQIYFQIYMSD